MSDDVGSDRPESEPGAVIEVFGDRADLARRYHDILATDGIEHGLIGPREVPRLWMRHILNCAVVSEALDEGESVIDIGSGAGLPGIPLAIVRPDLNVVLVEPLQRRTTFLDRVVDELGLEVRVVRGRAEERTIRADLGGADVVTSRAVAPLARLAGWSAPLIRPGGRMVALKGSSAHEEIERDSVAALRVGLRDLRVEVCGAPILGTGTTIVVGDKVDSSTKTKRSGRSERSTDHAADGGRRKG